jgi:hypothetical protein
LEYFLGKLEIPQMLSGTKHILDIAWMLRKSSGTLWRDSKCLLDIFLTLIGMFRNVSGGFPECFGGI